MTGNIDLGDKKYSEKAKTTNFYFEIQNFQKKNLYQELIIKIN